VDVIESAAATCAAFADAETLATGSSDYAVRLWRLARSSTAGKPPITLGLAHTMRAHAAEVTCVAASRPWSLVVSGGRDGVAVIWDLNKGVYVRSIVHGAGEGAEVGLVAINESTVSAHAPRACQC
jgi:WD40 repeat protein